MPFKIKADRQTDVYISQFIDNHMPDQTSLFKLKQIDKTHVFIDKHIPKHRLTDKAVFLIIKVC